MAIRLEPYENAQNFPSGSVAMHLGRPRADGAVGMTCDRPPPLVGAVVLNFRQPQGALAVVDAVTDQGIEHLRLIVVDNASQDGSAALLNSRGQVEVIELAQNGGYASGMNAGISRLLADESVRYVLLLTHDVELRPSCLTLLVEHLDNHPEAGVVAPMLERADTTGKLWSSGGYLEGLCRDPVHTGRDTDASAAPDSGHRVVEWADGAILMIRREVFSRIGLLPEQYFLYFEEVHFLLMAGRRGFQTHVVLAARAAQQPGGAPDYLAARNRVLLARSLFPARVALVVLHTLVEVLREVGRRVLRRSYHRTDFVQAVLVGTYDGLTGRLRKTFL